VIEMNNNQERRKLMKALRSMILRYRKAGKTDKVAIATFCYEKGLSRKDVEEMFEILIDAERISNPHKVVVIFPDKTE
jgi:ethanolamine utilization protein EutA (predicted chaperonin)